MSLQTRILLPMIMVIVIAVGGSVSINYMNTAQALEEALSGTMDSQIRGLNVATRNLIQDTLRNAVRTAERPDVTAFFDRPGDPDHVRAISRRLRDIADSYPDIFRISILDATGRTAASSDESTIDRNFAQRDYFKDPIRGTSHVTAPFVSAITNSGVIIASVPLFYEGRIQGVLICAVSLERYYADYVQPVRVGSEGYAYILGENGLIVAHPDNSLAFRENLPESALYQRIVAAGTGLEDYVNADGDTVRVQYLSGDMAGMTMVVQAYHHDVFSALTDIRRQALGISAAAILIGILVAFVLARSIARPVRQCAAFAGEVADGNLDAELAYRGRGEIGALAEAIRSIPASLKNILASYAEQEKKIEGGFLRFASPTDGLRGQYAELVAGSNTVLTRFNEILDAIPDPLIVVDREQTVRYGNAAAERLAGRPVSGQRFEALLEPENAGSPDTSLARALAAGRIATEEVAARPNGAAMDIRCASVPLACADGTVPAVLQVVTDLTALKEAQRTVLGMANKAADVAENVSSASSQLAAELDQMTQRAEFQRERVEHVVESVHQASYAVSDVAGRAGAADHQSREARERAQEGAMLVDEVITAISTVHLTAQALLGSMRNLTDQAKQVGGVINVINDIADQTNLLALNAAIEAARAGEYGRGFAVVADEVRKLAEKTMQATAEVAANVRGIQDAAAENMEQVAAAASEVNNATGLARRSGDALRHIVEISGYGSEMIHGIAAATEQQSVTLEVIRGDVDEINSVTEQTAAGTAQSAVAVSSLAQQVHQLNDLLERLRQSDAQFA